MSQNHGNKKVNNRRKRNTNPAAGAKTTVSTQRQEATQAPQKTQASRAPGRKETAQAEAKKKKQLQMIIGGVVLAVVVAVVLILVNRPTPSGIGIDYSGLEIAQSQIIASQGTPTAGEQSGALSFSTGPMVGDPNAPVTMHIFSDFQCNYCLQFHNETQPKIIDDFVRTGQVKLVFHDFPRLGTNPSIANPDDLAIELSDPNNESSLSSQAAMCAGEQDKYLEMADKLFGNYGGIQAGAFSNNNLSRFASDMKLDSTAFNACVDSGRYVQPLADSITQGQGQGITATPMFILDNGNGEPNVIQQTAEGYNLLKKQIELSVKTAP